MANYEIKLMCGRKQLGSGTLRIDPEAVPNETGDSIEAANYPADRVAYEIERLINRHSAYRAHVTAKDK